jgi:hypothetical protein
MSFISKLRRFASSSSVGSSDSAARDSREPERLNSRVDQPNSREDQVTALQSPTKSNLQDLYMFYVSARV